MHSFPYQLELNSKNFKQIRVEIQFSDNCRMPRLHIHFGECHATSISFEKLEIDLKNAYQPGFIMNFSNGALNRVCLFFLFL